MSENYRCSRRREKCFLLTSPFIEPAGDSIRGEPVLPRWLDTPMKLAL